VLQQPASLDNVVIFARAYEQWNVSHNTASSQSSLSASRYMNQTTALPAASTATTTPAPSETFINKLAPSSIRLSPSEIAQRCKDGKCFKCDELFTPSHHQHYKQLFIIEVIDEEEDDGLSPADGEQTISIHVLNRHTAAC
jgi:hypothetical protein